MNFQGIPPVETEKTLLDYAFRKAREKGIEKNLKGNWLEIIRKKEGLKIDSIKDMLVQRLEKTKATFPHPKQLPEFYVQLMKLTVDLDEYKKSLAAVEWALGRIRFFQAEYVKKIFRSTDHQKIKDLSRQFYGRIASVVKQINGNLRFLEESRKIFRTYPDVKEMFTVCIYGFPNVGKSTFLNKLTGTKAETAPYAFTTRSINAGYITVGEHKIQVLDVPGTLARGERMNLIERQAELVLKKLADVIIFVFDLSGYSGYSIKKQEQLYRNIGTEKKVLVYLSKLDLTEEEILSEWKHTYYSVEELKEKIGEEVEKKGAKRESEDKSEL
ncbi:50S ribosome-binding GTPase [Candidatus Woesearchaeota archaeon]|nr:50S ribosome-binding GTPase [Candidatus Woesearchaeota archaeon]